MTGHRTPAQDAVSDPGVVVHHFDHESRERQRRTVLGPPDQWTQTRWVCSCGAVGSWRKYREQMTAERDHHALDGQFAFAWPA